MGGDIHDPRFVADLFDRCSRNYRWWSAVASFGFTALWRRQCIDRLTGQRQVARISDGELGPKPSQMARVVDLMAGTGELWPHILRALPHARITAIDISHRMHLEALDRLHATRADRIEHIEADALSTDLPDGIADVVVASFGLKTLSPDQQAALARQIDRLLRPGGTFSLIEASDPRGWVLRPLYRFYMATVLPLIERLFLRGAQDFAMIATYTRLFVDCTDMEDALRARGLVVSQQRHFFGCATSVAGRKPIAPDPLTG